MRPVVVRLVVAVAVALLIGTTVAPGSASAHGSGGSDASNYRSEVVDPADPGLRWKLYGDALIELHNRTGTEVIVGGYDGEPYLRFTAGGEVFVNENSPAAYLNKERYARVDVPGNLGDPNDPRWERVATDGTYRWHDHRIHWMSPALPPQIDPSRDEQQLVWDWQIPVIVGTGEQARSLTVVGRLSWLPDVSWWPPVAGSAIVMAGFAGAVLLAAREHRWPARRLVRAPIVAVGLVGAANVVRTVDDLTAVPATGGEQFTIVAVAAVALGAIAALAWRARRGDAYGFLTLGLAGMAMMLLFGGEAARQLSAPELISGLPHWVRRWTVASSYTVLIPVLTAVALGAVRFAAHRAATSPVPAADHDRVS